MERRGGRGDKVILLGGGEEKHSFYFAIFCFNKKRCVGGVGMSSFFAASSAGGQHNVGFTLARRKMSTFLFN